MKFKSHNNCFIRIKKFNNLTNFKFCSNYEYFKTILGAENIIFNDKHELEKYNQDWMKKYFGKSNLVLKPNSTQQISLILKYCNKNNLKVLPQGGNTGLVGGSVPIDNEIIISKLFT